MQSCSAARAAADEWLLLFPVVSDSDAFLLHSGGHSKLDLLPPVWGGAPVRRYGPVGDGAKWLLDVDDRTPCVIYSLGSNLQTEFEEAVLADTPCDVVTLDCTVDAAAMADAVARAPHSAGRFSFKPYCLGVEGTEAKVGGVRTVLRSVAAVMAELGHARVDVLKMDVEGAEHNALPALLHDARGALPAQIVVELHWDLRGLSSLNVVRDLVRAGYVLAYREDNRFSPGSTELTFALGCADEDDVHGAARL